MDPSRRTGYQRLELVVRQGSELIVTGRRLCGRYEELLTDAQQDVFSPQLNE